MMDDKSPNQIDELRTWIGREETASDLVSIDLVQKFKATLDLSTTAPVWGEPAPLLINYCVAQPVVATSLLGQDGHPNKGGFLPPVPLPRRMWAGSNLVFHGELKVGDLVRRVSRIADIVFKKGRSGDLCFVVVQHSLDVAGSLKIEETQSIVYREAARPVSESNVAPSEPVPVGRHSRTVDVSAPLLFRYSALTFNGHRIHYDRSYATIVESYPGLVVHGPLQATLLVNYATELRNGPPSRFSFRAESPLCDGDRMVMHAADNGDSMTLWTAKENGSIAISAEATWS